MERRRFAHPVQTRTSFGSKIDPFHRRLAFYSWRFSGHVKYRRRREAFPVRIPSHSPCPSGRRNLKVAALCNREEMVSQSKKDWKNKKKGFPERVFNTKSKRRETINHQWISSYGSSEETTDEVQTEELAKAQTHAETRGLDVLGRSEGCLSSTGPSRRLCLSCNNLDRSRAKRAKLSSSRSQHLPRCVYEANENGDSVPANPTNHSRGLSRRPIGCPSFKRTAARRHRYCSQRPHRFGVYHLKIKIGFSSPTRTPTFGFHNQHKRVQFVSSTPKTKCPPTRILKRLSQGKGRQINPQEGAGVTYRQKAGPTYHFPKGIMLLRRTSEGPQTGAARRWWLRRPAYQALRGIYKDVGKMVSDSSETYREFPHHNSYGAGNQNGCLERRLGSGDEMARKELELGDVGQVVCEYPETTYHRTRTESLGEWPASFQVVATEENKRCMVQDYTRDRQHCLILQHDERQIPIRSAEPITQMGEGISGHKKDYPEHEMDSDRKHGRSGQTLSPREGQRRLDDSRQRIGLGECKLGHACPGPVCHGIKQDLSIILLQSPDAWYEIPERIQPGLVVPPSDMGKSAIHSSNVPENISEDNNTETARLDIMLATLGNNPCNSATYSVGRQQCMDSTQKKPSAPGKGGGLRCPSTTFRPNHSSFQEVLTEWGKLSKIHAEKITSNSLCPVKLMWDYLKESGRVERKALEWNLGRIDNNHIIFRKFKDNEPMGINHLQQILVATLKEAGIDTSIYTGHSYRHAGTTKLLGSEVPHEDVKGWGRWRSDAFLTYKHGWPAEKMVKILTSSNNA